MLYAFPSGFQAIRALFVRLICGLNLLPKVYAVNFALPPLLQLAGYQVANLKDLKDLKKSEDLRCSR